ncbi:hypothetical protein ASG37_10165 [Sphingomonas sp. Leaf407]|uniref:STAS domain-containing protein n=1 Tax=unclassified Sphingomonas TaxID=196159 RepID=UPI0006FB4B62|nr:MULTISPECIES: STAS domain-containing protein [unclassified Sphingomonas]KQN37412.1 hypothetical protein ASE97_07455 [Sphingomonas sp. Leaf42]KQT27781.1 hypothetical protein ASG37_10165 [Sphingomonas sp. Leaf407]
MTPLPLSAVLDTAAAPALRDLLVERLSAGEPLLLDGSGVERIGQACLQVLIAAETAARAAGVAFAIDAPSPALADMTALAGLSPLLAA